MIHRESVTIDVVSTDPLRERARMTVVWEFQRHDYADGSRSWGERLPEARLDGGEPIRPDADRFQGQYSGRVYLPVDATHTWSWIHNEAMSRAARRGVHVGESR